MKKTFLCAALLSVCCSMSVYAASAVNEDSMGSSGYPVSITIPAEYSGVSSQKEADMIVGRGEAVSAVFHTDGSVTYQMTAEMHRIFVDSVREKIGYAMDAAVADGVRDTVTEISANDTFTVFDIKTSVSEAGEDEKSLAESAICWGDFFLLCAGEKPSVIEVNIRNDESGSLIDTIRSEAEWAADAEAEEGGDVHAAKAENSADMNSAEEENGADSNTVEADNGADSNTAEVENDPDSGAAEVKEGKETGNRTENPQTAGKIYHDSATIKEVQTLLNKLGYECGKEDGVAGENTNGKIWQYKRDHGLPENPDITEEFLISLRNAQ